MIGNTRRQSSMTGGDLDATLLNGSSHPKPTRKFATRTSGETASPREQDLRSDRPHQHGMRPEALEQRPFRSRYPSGTCPVSLTDQQSIAGTPTKTRTLNRATVSGSTAGPEMVNPSPAFGATGAIAIAERWLTRCGTGPYKDRYRSSNGTK